jgi:hypothetical protein
MAGRREVAGRVEILSSNTTSNNKYIEISNSKYILKS